MTTKTNMTCGLAQEEAKHQHLFDGPTYLSVIERQRRKWLTLEEHDCVLELAIAQTVRA